MNDKIEITEEPKADNKVKAHFKRNGKVYIAVGVGLAVGVLATVAYQRGIITTSHLGNVVQDTTTGKIFASQKRAAQQLRVPQSQISQHLNGQLEDVKGHVFTKLGRALPVPD